MIVDEPTRIKSVVDPKSCWPLEPDAEYYESSIDGERGWISFRDPFFFHDNGQKLLLMAARAKEGPLVRRGCVGVMEETAPNHFESRPPIHDPRVYDDIEVPNLMRIEDDYYLIGSLREDAKIRYWHTDSLLKPWQNYYDNVLLPTGNYAGRTCRDESGLLLWNFYTRNLGDRTVNNLMPPPKRLARCDNGQLRCRTYEGILNRVADPVDTRCISKLKEGRGEQFCRMKDQDLHLVSEAGFQAFVFDSPLESFRLRAMLNLKGQGKCGLLSRVDPTSHDGYYISLDLMKGMAQFRSWGTGAPGSGEHMMQFESIQSGNWYSESNDQVEVQLIAFGSYHELSVNGNVILSLTDPRFEVGKTGFYVETADLKADGLVVETLKPPTQTDEHLTKG